MVRIWIRTLIACDPLINNCYLSQQMTNSYKDVVLHINFSPELVMALILIMMQSIEVHLQMLRCMCLRMFHAYAD